MTNKEWLDYLAHNAPDELAAWFDAEHTETTISDTMRHIGQVIEDTVMRGVYGDTEPENEDSRELILTDLEKKTREWHDYDGNFMRIYSDVAYAQIKELLDRQAAITDAEWEDELEQLHIGYKPLIDELQAQVDTLKSRHCPHYHANEHTCDVHETRIAELTAERDNWKEHSRTIEYRCKKAETDCEIYRKKFGKCLDYADAIHALMDDEGMA